MPSEAETALQKFINDEARKTAAALKAYRKFMATRKPGEFYKWPQTMFMQIVPKGHAYQGVLDFLSKHGQFFTPQPLPKKYRQRKAQACFENAYSFVKKSGGALRYVEGLAVSTLRLPMHHAWAVDAENRVIDPTWRDNGLAYYGVPLPLHMVEQARALDAVAVNQGMVQTSVFADEARGFPIFEKPFKG